MSDSDDQPPAITIPTPIMAPFGTPLNAEAVQEVWNTYVKPGQDAGMPPSIEERLLMAILRAVYLGMVDAEAVS